MLNLLFLLLVPFATSGPATGHPAAASFPAARKAARAEKRPIAIFFAPPACHACEVDWNKFLESPEARTYIPLKLSPEDFDAKAILDAWGPATVPGWTILQADGTVLERWTGRWDRSPWPEMPVAPQSPGVQTAKEKNGGEMPVRSALLPPGPMATTAVESPTPSTASGNGFRIQAGFFGSGSNAENLLRQLAAKGFAGYEIQQGQRDGKPFFRVVSAVYPSEAGAREAAPILAKAGFNAAVKPTNEL